MSKLGKFETPQDYTERCPLLLCVDRETVVENDNSIKHRIQTFQDDRHVNHCNTRDAEVDAQTCSRFKFSNLGRKDKCVLIFCFLRNFVAACTLAMLPPFYPPEAERRNVPVWTIGFVFCVFEVVRSIAEHTINRRFLSRYSVKAIYVTSLVSATAGCFVFSTIQFINPNVPWQFILLSMLSQCLQATGTSGLAVSSTVIVSNSFPTQALRWTGVGTTLGYVIGPPMGGWLYSIGGFTLPFYIMGTVTFLHGLMFYLFVPFPHRTRQNPVVVKAPVLYSRDNMDPHSTYSPTIPTLISPAAGVFACAVTISCLDPILSNHIMVFYEWDVVLTGLLFAIPHFARAILTPLWECLVDDQEIQSSCHTLGLLFIVSGCAILGPSPLLSFINSQSWTVIVGLVLIGAGTSCVLLLAMTSLSEGKGRGVRKGTPEREAALEDSGYNDVDLESSKVYNVSYLMGVVLGPVLGAGLMELFGFRVTTSVIACFSLLCVILHIFLNIVCCLRNKCGWILPGSRRGDDCTIAHVDCVKCDARRKEGTFGVLPR